MQAVCCTAPNTFEVRTVPVPDAHGDQVLVKVSYCGICGSDRYISGGLLGELTKWPLILGHEVVGKVAKVGADVTEFSEGDRVVIDPLSRCNKCFFCRRGMPIQCTAMTGLGVTVSGGFSEYVTVPSSNVFKIHNITDEEATLIEPTACAIHAVDKLNLKVGSEVLILGSGPSGIMLSQICKVNGASKVVLASNKGMKMDMAKKVGAADEYFELDRNGPEEQWKTFKEANPYGFDAVVEATGSANVANDAINYVRRGGTLLLYSFYADGLVHWPPSKIFGDEIQIIGAFSQHCAFPRAVAYIDGGKVNVKGLVTHTYNHHQFQDAIDKLVSRDVMKIAVKP
ncbi:NADP+-dependent D-mannitol dehydrogenase [Dendrothele bispora CBS 962.96]|uniref:NADP+-dependent D-mannitol dehydrogenase n=1 Tax=Dendrothele bispora (strain CBS 962.96) TaxID=1314807 RepID=A0A4S8MX65_DENBC|nr:NADP+-dependent D-mannitol dehydrogenase [Dendrothele bispora CBS 962.96]